MFLAILRVFGDFGAHWALWRVLDNNACIWQLCAYWASRFSREGGIEGLPEIVGCLVVCSFAVVSAAAFRLLFLFLVSFLLPIGCSVSVWLIRGW